MVVRAMPAMPAYPSLSLFIKLSPVTRCIRDAACVPDLLCTRRRETRACTGRIALSNIRY